MMRDVSVKIGEFMVDRYGRHAYAIWDKAEELIAVTVYKRGAIEVAHRLKKAKG